MFKKLISAVLVAATFASTSSAEEVIWQEFAGISADTSAHLAESGWSLHPIISEGLVLGVFGQLKLKEFKGHNVSLVWAKPDSSGHWRLYGWNHRETAGAIAYIQKSHGNKTVLAELLEATETKPQFVVEPEAMPHGLLLSDPLAKFVAENPDPSTVEMLIDNGAAGSPVLSLSLLETVGCPSVGSSPATNLDAMLSYAAFGMSVVMTSELSSSITASVSMITGGTMNPAVLSAANCAEVTFTFYSLWNPWGCTGGPTLTAGGKCKFTGCSRTRTCTTVSLSSVTSTLQTQTQSCRIVPAITAGSCAGVTP